MKFKKIYEEIKKIDTSNEKDYKRLRIQAFFCEYDYKYIGLMVNRMYFVLARWNGYLRHRL